MEDGLLGTDLPTSWREQYTFLKVFYGNVFFACLSFGLFTPWIHEYLDQVGCMQTAATSSTAFPILMANSVGEIVGALVFGSTAKKYSTKTALLACIFVGFLGCLLFLSSTLAHTALVPVSWLIIGRFLQGVWTGGEQTVELAYVSDVVADEDKLKVLSELGIASVAGFLFGPGLGMAMHLLGIHFGATFAYFPAAVHALCTAGVFLLTNTYFHELPLDCRLAGILDHPISKPNFIGLVVSNVLMFVIMTSFAVCEHISKPLMTHDYEVTRTQVIITAVQNEREDTYEVLAIALAVTVVAYLVVHWSDGKVIDRKILQCAQILVAVGWFFTFDYEANILSYTSFIAGVTIGSFSIPICRLALVSMYSKILGPNPAVLAM